MSGALQQGPHDAQALPLQGGALNRPASLLGSGSRSAGAPSASETHARTAAPNPALGRRYRRAAQAKQPPRRALDRLQQHGLLALREPRVGQRAGRGVLQHAARELRDEPERARRQRRVCDHRVHPLEQRRQAGAGREPARARAPDRRSALPERSCDHAARLQAPMAPEPVSLHPVQVLSCAAATASLACLPCHGHKPGIMTTGSHTSEL